MAQGAVITPQIKELIVGLYIDHPDDGPTRTRKKLLEKMKEVGLDKIFGPDWPGVSSVGKLLSEYRQRDAERSPELKRLDCPWRILDISQYPIPPETLPIVLKAWGRSLEADNPITIREALWIARLYYVFREAQVDPMRYAAPKSQSPEEVDYLNTEEGKEKLFIDLLNAFAYAYANHEIICEFGPGHPVEPEDMWGTWWRDGILHWILTGKEDIQRILDKELEKRLPEDITDEDLRKAFQSTYRHKEANNHER